MGYIYMWVCLSVAVYVNKFKYVVQICVNVNTMAGRVCMDGYVYRYICIYVYTRIYVCI